MTFFRFISALAALVLLPAFGARACDSGTVRDAAVKARRDLWQLVVVTGADDAAANAAWPGLEAWFAARGEALNVRLERISPGESTALRDEYGIETLPENLPATFLCGWHPGLKRPFAARQWPGLPQAPVLASLEETPALAAARKSLPGEWAVLLYARGDGPDRSAEVDAAAKAWNETYPPGVTVVRLDRTDPGESLLCDIAGIKADGADWVGVLFGCGKIMLPMLHGDSISRARIRELLDKLVVPCTCLQQAFGFAIDLPMRWDPALTARTAALTGPQGYTEAPLDAKVRSLMEDAPTPTPASSTAQTLLVPLVAIAPFALYALWLLRGVLRGRRDKPIP